MDRKYINVSLMNNLMLVAVCLMTIAGGICLLLYNWECEEIIKNNHFYFNATIFKNKFRFKRQIKT